MIFHAGLHYHYKGGEYLALHITETHNHNGDRDIVYVSLTTGKIVTRPFKQDSRKEDAWTDLVQWPDGQKHARFTHHSLFQKEWLINLSSAHALGDAHEPPTTKMMK